MSDEPFSARAPEGPLPLSARAPEGALPSSARAPEGALRPTRGEFAFACALRVRWSEVDPQGIVFNPNYFVYADIAMTEYMRAIGFSYPDALTRHGTDMFAIGAEAAFFGSAVYDDELTLAARVEYLGRTSFRLLTGIFRGDALLTQIRMTYVNASLKEKTPEPLCEEFVQKVASYERTPPLRK